MKLLRRQDERAREQWLEMLGLIYKAFLGLGCLSTVSSKSCDMLDVQTAFRMRGMEPDLT